MCRENSLNQINAAAAVLENAVLASELVQAQTLALAFTQAAFDAEEITQAEKQSLEKKVRRIYRNQLIGEAT